MNYKELNNTFKKLSKWYGKKIKVLNLKTRPFNSIEIFSNIINKVLNENKNILYVFCSEEKEHIKVRINEIYDFLDNTISKKQLENNIHFANIGDIEDIDESYDLVIFVFKNKQ